MNLATEIRAALHGKILAIHPDWLDAALARLAIEGMDAEARKPLAQPRSRSGKVAMLGVYGFIQQRADIFTRLFGGVSTDEMGEALDRLVADPSVDQIVLDFDTPGGEVYGVESLANKIHAAKQTKNVYAISNSLAASAGYWLASQASEVWVAPGGEVGSIGVYSMHTDISEAEKSFGVKRTFIKAGKYKAAGNPFEPLSDEVKARFQAQVSSYYDTFVSSVARGRDVRESVVRNGFGEGMTMLDHAAVKEGMADKVGTLQELLASLGVKDGSSTGRRAEDEEPKPQADLCREQAILAGLST